MYKNYFCFPEKPKASSGKHLRNRRFTMNVKLEFILRDIAGDLLLVPAGKAALDLNGMLTLNEVGAEIWKRLPEAEDEEALVQALLQEYEVEEEVLRADVREFLDSLRQLGIL
jgi:hypothetical protein